MVNFEVSGGYSAYKVW